MTQDHSSRPLAAIFGEWSQSNIGDHAIHEGVRNFFNECGWRVKSFDFGALRPSTEPLALSRSPAAARAPWIYQLPPFAKRTLRGMRQQILMKRLMPQLADVDAICVGGGALLTDINLHFPQSLAALLWAANELNKPLLCLGCSAEGPWSKRGEDIIRQFVTRCDFIAVRDRESARRIAGALGGPVPTFGDFAMPVTTLHAIQSWKHRYALAINVTHVPAPFTLLQDQYEDELVDLARAAISQAFPGQPVVIFTTGTAQDVSPAIRVHSRLAPLGAELHLGKNLTQLRGIMRSSEVVIAARLHAGIIALAERVPVIGFSATPKIKSFFETVGLGRHAFGLRDPASQIIAELRRLTESPDQIMASAPEIVETRKQVQNLLSILSREHYYSTAISA